MSGTAAAGSVPFVYTPSNILVPMLTLEMSNSQANFNVQTQIGLLIGQSLVAQPEVPVCVFSTAQARSLFGRGSILARAVEKYLLNDTLGYVWCLPLADASGGVAATYTLIVSAASALAGTIPLYIAGQNVPVAVNTGDTSTAIATNIAAAINAAPDLPVTAAAATGTVTLTCKWKGATGSTIDIRVAYYGTLGGESLPSGVSLGVSFGVTGTQDPDLTGVAAALGSVPYDFIFSPYSGAAQTAALTGMMNFSTGRWGPLRQIYGHVWTALVGSEASLAAITGAMDDAHTTLIGIDPCPTPAWEMGAACMGAAAPAIRNQPNAGLQGIQVQGVLAPAAGSRFTEPQQQALLSTGCGTLSYDQAGGVYLQRMVTTYQDNQFGQPDQSYLDAPTLYGIMAGNRIVAGDLGPKLANGLIFADGTAIPPGVKGFTPSGVKALLAGSYQLGVSRGLYQNVQDMLANSIVQINQQNPGRIDILFAPDLVYGLYNTAILNQFRFVTGQTSAAA
jgi:phage tail sheath gpL-like